MKKFLPMEHGKLKKKSERIEARIELKMIQETKKKKMKTGCRLSDDLFLEVKKV